MEIITGYTGTAHVTADQDRDINIGLCGGGSYVMQTGMQMAAEVSTNNEIKIRDGVIMHQGCAACIKKNTYDSLTINNGSQGMKRIDLIVARYQRNPETGVESLNLLVIQGTPSASDPLSPSGTTGDIQAGDTIADMELYRVHIDGLSIVEVEKLFEVIQSAAELKEMVAELNSKCSTSIETNGTEPTVQSSADTWQCSIKYTDGRMIEYGRCMCHTFGNTYAMSGNVKFISKFAALPMVITTLNNENNSIKMIDCHSSVNPAMESCNIWVHSPQGRIESGDLFRAYYVALGRWK